MSSHREAPEISKDPAADNADVYAFVSPDHPDTVTLISNFVPLQDPPGGPNFFEFGDDVQYSIYIDNDGDGKPEISYVFNFTTRLRDPNTFLYNTGPITSLGSQNWNKRQFYSVTRVDGPTRPRTGRRRGRHKHKPNFGHGPRSRARLPAVQHRATLDAELREPRRKRRSTASRAGSKCSRGSVRTASSSTWARPSTSPTCGRSRTCT